MPKRNSLPGLLTDKTGTRYVIRHAQEEDYGQIARFVNSAHSPENSPELARLNPEASKWKWDVAGLAREVSVFDEYFSVADASGKVVACVGYLTRTGKEPRFEIRKLFVERELQGRGLGAVIAGHVESIARSLGARKIDINAYPDSQKFYERLGYSVDSQSDYDNPVFRAMSKSLK